MAARTIEARLVISGEDRASQAIANVVKTVRQLEDAAKVSKPLQDVAKSLMQVEQAEKAVSAAMSARSGFAAAEAGLKATQGAAHAAAQALNEAKVARAAYDGVKAVKGSQEAAQIEAATKAVRDASAAHRKAESDVRRATAAFTAHTATLGHAEAAAAKYGANLGQLEAHQVRLHRDIENTTQAIVRQVRAEEQATRVGTVMGSAGRVQLERIEQARRLTDGMSAQTRATQRLREEEVRLGQAEQQRVRIKAAEDRIERRQARVDAYRGAAGILGVAAVHKAEHFAGHALHTYQEFDNERRFGKVVMGLTDEEQKPLVDQAIHMGATTRYNDVQVLEAQRELAARGLKKDQVMGLMSPAADLGQSLDLRLPDAVKQMEGAIFGFKKDISTLEAAKASARQTADVQVKAAKISGMTPEDISQAYKYGATPARLSGVSEQTLLAFGGISKKANIGGDEAGVAFRALIANAQSPTQKAREAMLANGLDYKNYQKNPEKLDEAAFTKQVSASYGVKLDKTTRAGINKIFSDKNLIASPEKFTPAIMSLLSDNLGGDDAKSKKSIAGLANRFRNASMQGVDTNALIADLMKKLPGNLALANAVFGSKQGGRIANALGDPETFKHMIEELLKHSEGYAEKVSTERMAGFDGAVKRFQGAVTNLETKLGRAWDDDGKGGGLTALTNKAGQFVQHLAEMDNALVRAGSVAAAVGTVFVGLKSVGLLQSGFGLKTSAVALDSSAAALSAAAVKLGGGSLGGLPGAPGADGGKPKGGKLKGAIGVGANLVGGLLLEPLAEVAQEHHIFEVPNLDDGLARSGLNFLDPNLGNAVLGDRARAFPSMAIKPREQPMTLGGTGLNTFGLTGPQSPEALAKRDADRYTRGLVEARRSAAPLNPGDELPGLSGLSEIAATKGAEAGKKVGEGIRSGIETKAPEVEQQGRTLYEKIKELFAEGIRLPINFAPGSGMGGEGGGGGLIHRASFGGSGSGSVDAMVRRGPLGGGSGTAVGALGESRGAGLGGGVSSDGIGSGSDYLATVGGKTYRSAYGAGGRERVDSWLDFYQRPVDQGGLGMVPDKARAMVAMMQGESGINLSPGAMGDYRGRTPTAFGTAQWRLERAANLRTTAAKMGLHWTDVRAQQAHMRAEMLGEYGPRGSYRGVYDAIQAAPSGDAALAIGIDRYENPAKKALAYRFRHPYLQALRRDKNRPTAPADEPRLVKGLDGKEGLDLGDGTMKMPDGSIRSITRGSGLTIPEPPAGGFGGGGGRGDMRAAAERMHQAADRMEGMGFHGQIQLAVTGPGRDSVRATGMRTRGRGGMSADMGVSMPGAKESDGDWV